MMRCVPIRFGHDHRTGHLLGRIASASSLLLPKWHRTKTLQKELLNIPHLLVTQIVFSIVFRYDAS
jgi:hypothetical protein